MNQSVNIAGQVQRSVSVVNGQLYQIQDDSGSVWVRVSATVFTEAVTDGQIDLVKGTVQYEEILVGNANLSEYYVEAERVTLEVE